MLTRANLMTRALKGMMVLVEYLKDDALFDMFINKCFIENKASARPDSPFKYQNFSRSASCLPVSRSRVAVGHLTCNLLHTYTLTYVAMLLDVTNLSRN